MKNTCLKEQHIWSLLRFALGIMFLWPFFDKLFGLGFSTTPDKSWLAGVSPTYGFLKMGSSGPLAGFYQSIAGNPITDTLFMLALLMIGLALILGIGLKIAGYSGALLTLSMWSVVLPPKGNPLLDQHIVFFIIFIAFTFVKAGQCWGLGKWWSNTKLVKKFPILE